MKIRHWLIISGGVVINAEINKRITMAILWFFFIQLDVINPIEDKSLTKIGS